MMDESDKSDIMVTMDPRVAVDMTVKPPLDGHDGQLRQIGHQGHDGAGWHKVAVARFSGRPGPDPPYCCQSTRAGVKCKQQNTSNPVWTSGAAAGRLGTSRTAGITGRHSGWRRKPRSGSAAQVWTAAGNQGILARQAGTGTGRTRRCSSSRWT